MIKKCSYCDLPLKTDDQEKETHVLCDKLKEFSNGRNLTKNNGYWMSYVPPEKQDRWPNLSVNSRGYAPVHQVVARLLLNRDLNAQDSEDPEVVDHIAIGIDNKLNFAPWNLRVMKLKDHVSEHKRKDSPRRR